MGSHVVKNSIMVEQRKRAAQNPRPRGPKATYNPTKGEEDALARRIKGIVQVHTARCGEPENWADAGKAEKLVEQLYRNELLRIQALKDSGALVPLAEVAKRDELTAGAFMWALGEMLEWASERIPAHQRNEVRQAGSVKLAEILAEVSRSVASGMEEVEEEPEDGEVLPVEDEEPRE
jgi:hypothetical protein